MIDGAYIQSEEFVLRVPGPTGLAIGLRLDFDQVVALHEVTGKMIAAREEARAWPFGDYIERGKRAALVPTHRPEYE